jgi:transcriptional regulator with XRE-family HTH domain
MTKPEPAGVQVDGPVVRGLRKVAGHNLQDLAEKAGISLQYLSMIERGERSMSPRKFAALADALGVAPSERGQLLRSGTVATESDR